MQAMMQQAQKLQRDMMKAKNEIDEKKFTSTQGLTATTLPEAIDELAAKSGGLTQEQVQTMIDTSVSQIELTPGPQGPAGADGHTPVKGTDYFTDADKTELVNAVLAAIPNGDEVSY